MTKSELNEIIKEIKEETNERVMQDPETHMVLTAPVAIAVLRDVFSGGENG